ncbi:two component transcriptional regulator, LuxR family [Chthoniobacter flavus Ellin428]|uniref:Two component transcriptional regulator, LuxR family n=1 Tax=Chthoniobacter flavus Ellin428 TaxID=497964 RepID=B4CV47_9BACT|nr:response regulator transcription factor [Chthoniobacter flavus]EDY22435.1 two component transcriptional regulator, LuxR family [Chthoniobacter flavus Ellin428]TCO94556.1 LuxR family two component transcriptional regulator [Chthoniobacter flavus]
MKTAAIGVLLVDDHFMVRRGLAVALRVEKDLAVVAEAGNCEEMLAAYRQHRPDVVLLDWRLPGPNGAEATALLREEHPGARVLMLSALDGDEHIHLAVRAGAAGYVLKSAERGEIIQAIRAVHGGKSYFSPGLEALLHDRARKVEISPREREVLVRAAAGERNKEIGDHLGISEATVKVFMARIFQKLDARDRAHAVVIAIKRGIIDPS